MNTTSLRPAIRFTSEGKWIVEVSFSPMPVFETRANAELFVRGVALIDSDFKDQTELRDVVTAMSDNSLSSSLLYRKLKAALTPQKDVTLDWTPMPIKSKARPSISTNTPAPAPPRLRESLNRAS